MFDIMTITGPIYFSIAVGYVATRFGLFAKTDRHVLGKFVINLAVPALLFKALAEGSIGKVLNSGYLVAYLLGTFVVIGVGMLWFRCIARKDQTSSALCTMGMSCSNSVLIGYPVLLFTSPTVAGLAMALNTLMEHIIAMPLMLTLAESGRVNANRWYHIIGQSLARLYSNPMIIALTAGLLCSLSGWKIPQPVAQTLGLFAMATGALSLFVIGSTLVGLPIQGMAKQIVPIVVGKLILHPLMVALSLLVLPLLGLPAVSQDLRIAAIVMAAMPMLAIYPILAQMFGQEEFAATALLITTITSFFTLSVILWVFRIVPM